MTESYPEIRVDQTPTTDCWQLTPLYLESITKGIMRWQIAFDGERLCVSWGVVNGAIDMSELVVETNSSGRSLQQQALLQARQRYRLKWRDGYRTPNIAPSVRIRPMRGETYQEGSIKYWPVYTQPKLNGVRMLASIDSGNAVRLTSRNGLSYSHFEHFDQDLLDFFCYLPAGSSLDGELYSPTISFNEIISYARTVKSPLPSRTKLQYWLFDVIYDDPLGAPYECRYELLVNAYDAYIEDHGHQPVSLYVIPAELAHSHADLVKQHDHWVSEGYEGLMIKKISNGSAAGTACHTQSLYRPTRCKNILKYKNFIEEEATIVDVDTGVGREAGVALLVVKDERGNILRLRAMGDFEQRRCWYNDPSLVIGKQATIRYQTLSDYGVPLFCVVVAVRDYE
jgi:hypothetical protein